MDHNVVPTQGEARQWAARLIAGERFGWDGINLEQDGCDVVREALGSCSVTLTWPDGQSITVENEDR